jgi:hypothetical protein
MKNAILRIIFLFLFSFSAVAQMEIVEIEKPQLAKSIAGVVSDPSGAALPGVTVEQRSDDWKKVIRSTRRTTTVDFIFQPVRRKLSITSNFHVPVLIGFGLSCN